jgi:hypothetical protein
VYLLELKNGLAHMVMGEEVVKPRSLIHIAHNVSLLQMQLWDFILSKTPQDKIINESVHQIAISEIVKFLGNTRNRKHIEVLLEEMATIHTYSISLSTVDHGRFPFFSSTSIENGILSYTYPTAVKKAFASQGPCSSANLSMLRKFDCKYALFLYSLCLDYKNLKQTPQLTLQQFYQYMGIESGA